MTKNRNSVIAAIDVGTNSVHMVVARVAPDGFEILTTEKEIVRLGEGGADVLTDDAMDRAVSALKRMGRIAAAHGAKVRAVATSAVREADNADEFIKRVAAEAGVKVEIIAGAEEARLIWMGVSRAIVFDDRRTLVIDIGGGSTEFALSTGDQLHVAQSLKLGAVRLADMFDLHDDASEKSVRDLRAHIRSKIAGLVHDIGVIGVDRVILSSGTCETVARMVAVRRQPALPLSMNGFTSTKNEIVAVRKEILACGGARERAALAGMDPKRADIIVAGVVLLDEILRALDVDSIEYCEFALREGLLADTISRDLGDDHHRLDAGMQSVVRLARRCSVDLEHNGHIAMLSSRIFRELAEHYELDARLERLLVAAAYLSNAGNSVSYSRHHHHSYYIIRNADLLGFTDAEIEIIALAARYHRKSLPKESHSEYASLDASDRDAVDVVAGILRIATGLDRTHDQCVTDVVVETEYRRSSDTVKLIALCTCSGEGIDLNLYAAQRGTELLSKFLEATIEIEARGKSIRR
ncbi:MAG: hypothetical protein RJB08_1465 [Actinomycetota bacterium]